MRTAGCLLGLALMLAAAGADANELAAATPGQCAAGEGRLVMGSPTPDRECEIVYSDTTNSTGMKYLVQTNTVMDDLHMNQGGYLCSFDVGYEHHNALPIDMTVTFYATDLTDAAPTLVVAGPYLLPACPEGRNIVHFVTAPDGPLLPPDVWMAVTFAATGSGLLIYDPPTTGMSHDVFYQQPPGSMLWFGGDPVANFRLQVQCDPSAPVKFSTWGAVKALYR